MASFAAAGIPPGSSRVISVFAVRVRSATEPIEEVRDDAQRGNDRPRGLPPHARGRPTLGPCRPNPGTMPAGSTPTARGAGSPTTSTAGSGSGSGGTSRPTSPNAGGGRRDAPNGAPGRRLDPDGAGGRPRPLDCLPRLHPAAPVHRPPLGRGVGRVRRPADARAHGHRVGRVGPASDLRRRGDRDGHAARLRRMVRHRAVPRLAGCRAHDRGGAAGGAPHCGRPWHDGPPGHARDLPPVSRQLGTRPGATGREAGGHPTAVLPGGPRGAEGTPAAGDREEPGGTVR